MKNRKSTVLLRLLLTLCVLFISACVIVTAFYIPSRATWVYGPSSSSLSLPQRIQYSGLLLWYDGLLTHPLDTHGAEQSFSVETGESVSSIASRLEVTGLVRDASAFRTYLIYAGLDTSIQAGEY